MKNLSRFCHFHEGAPCDRAVKIIGSFLIAISLAIISASGQPTVQAQEGGILALPATLDLALGAQATVAAAPHGNQSVRFDGWNRFRNEYQGIRMTVRDACGIEVSEVGLLPPPTDDGPIDTRTALGLLLRLARPSTTSLPSTAPLPSTARISVPAPAPVLTLPLGMDTTIERGKLYYVEGYDNRLKLALVALSTSGTNTATLVYCSPSDPSTPETVLADDRSSATLPFTARSAEESDLSVEYTPVTPASATRGIVRIRRGVVARTVPPAATVETRTRRPDLVPIAVSKPLMRAAPLSMFICNMGDADVSEYGLRFVIGSGAGDMRITAPLQWGRCQVVESERNVAAYLVADAPDQVEVTVEVDTGRTVEEGVSGERNNRLVTRVLNRPDLYIVLREAPHLLGQINYQACATDRIRGIDDVRLQFYVNENTTSGRRLQRLGPFYINFRRSDHRDFFNGGCAWAHTNRTLGEFFTPRSRNNRTQLEAKIDDDRHVTELDERNNSLTDSSPGIVISD